MNKVKWAVLAPSAPPQINEDDHLSYEVIAREVGWPMTERLVAGPAGTASAVALVRLPGPFGGPVDQRPVNDLASELLGAEVRGTMVLVGGSDPLSQRVTSLPDWIIERLDASHG